LYFTPLAPCLSNDMIAAQGLKGYILQLAEVKKNLNTCIATINVHTHGLLFTITPELFCFSDSELYQWKATGDIITGTGDNNNHQKS